MTQLLMNPHRYFTQPICRLAEHFETFILLLHHHLQIDCIESNVSCLQMSSATVNQEPIHLQHGGVSAHLLLPNLTLYKIIFLYVIIATVRVRVAI